MDDDRKLPEDGWIALHRDGTVCCDWAYAGLTGQGAVPCLRFRDDPPQALIECEEGGEQLRWAQVTVMPVNAAARQGGAARFMDDDDA
jgi:hypothetical protein